MYFKALHIISLVLVCFSVSAQNRHLTDAQRDEQINFIRHDTLSVTVEALPDEINSRFSEYSGKLLPDSTFLFSSMRADADEDFDHLFETSWYCNLYQSKLLSDGSYLPAIPLPSIINTHKAFNSNLCYLQEKELLIFTRCTRASNGDLQCSLWQSSRHNGEWSKPKKLPSSINAEGSSSMQPDLVSENGQDILYFVSNRKHGIGGYDIWYSIYKDGHFDSPINAGPVINTEGNEVTPFYDKTNGILYFSSDEHLGIGDYDIFYSIGALSQWGEVSNMGVPFNSEYNDYYFTLNEGGQNGYFSSNRPHDNMDASDTCCNDLFYYKWHPFDVPDSIPIPTAPSLSEKIASVLPITLYFQNDEPNPKSTADTTNEDYPTLYRRYLSDNNLYVSESGRGLSGKQQSSVRQEMLEFLQDSVATGYNRLQQLVQYLKEALQNGETVELTISGYASPLHHSDYNLHLSARRITSLTNYLSKAENGFFLPYLTHEKQGLVIRTNPEGAVQHSFQTNEARETVYGLQAAKDRKIIIIGKIVTKQSSSINH